MKVLKSRQNNERRPGIGVGMLLQPLALQKGIFLVRRPERNEDTNPIRITCSILQFKTKKASSVSCRIACQ